MSGAESALIGPAAPPALHVMSWNVRRRTDLFTLRAADRWGNRAPRVRALLGTERPTLLGAQEALAEQAEFLRESLGAGYRLVGEGRGAGGRGEGCPILYDAARLELLDWDQAALSDTPSRPGSASWGNIFPRILVSAAFRDRATSTRFLMLNTHLDHLSGRSRLRSAQAIRELIADRGLPAVVTGDLNAGASSAPLRALLADGMLVDSWATAHSRDSQHWDTFSNYRAPRQRRGCIDWILTSPGLQVARTAINPHQYSGGWASDHLPVQTVLRLTENGENP